MSNYVKKYGIWVIIGLFVIFAIFYFGAMQKKTGDVLKQTYTYRGDKLKKNLKQTYSYTGGNLKETIVKNKEVEKKTEFAYFENNRKYLLKLSSHPYILCENQINIEKYANLTENNLIKFSVKPENNDSISKNGITKKYTCKTGQKLKIYNKNIGKKYSLPIKIDTDYKSFAITGCDYSLSGRQIVIKDFKQKDCSIAILLNSGITYKFFDKKLKIESPTIVKINLQAKRQISKVESRIKNSTLETRSFYSDKVFFNIAFISSISGNELLLKGIGKNVKLAKEIENIKNTKDAKQFGIKVETGVNFKDVFGISPYKGAPQKVKEIKDFKITYQSGNTIISLDNLKEGKYILYTKDKVGYDYFINFKVVAKIPENFYTFDDYRESFYFDLYSDYPLNKNETIKNIKNFFKGDKVVLEFSDNNKILYAYYRPIPGKVYSGNLVFSTIVGDVKEPFSLKIDKIPSKYTYAGIEGQKVNILPKNGFWGNHISIGYKNLKEFDLYFQQCSFFPAGPFKISYYSPDIERIYFDCKGKVIHKKFIAKNFKYWEEKFIDYSLPDEVKNFSFFRVSFYKDFSKGTKYFKRTDLGLFVKKGDKNYIFVNSFQTGKPVNDANIIIYTKDGKPYKTLKTKNGQASFTGDLDLFNIFVQKGNDNTFATIGKTDRYRYWPKNGEPVTYEIQTFIDSNDIGQDDDGGNNNFIKIYGYTDRGLYKAGDIVFFAGWVRNLKDKRSIPKGKVIVKLLSYGEEKQKVEITKLDDFGGFEGKFKLPKNIDLGVYQVKFIFANGVSYSQNIKVQEFQKPTFFAKTKLVNQEGTIFLKIQPKYYFGADLKDYNLSVNWSLAGKDICRDCRWWNEKDYYYNWVFKNTISTGGNINLTNLKDQAILKLIQLDSLKNLSYKITLKADIRIKDNKTNEVHFYTEYLDIPPVVKIGLAGQPTERLYSSDVKDGKYTIKGKVLNPNPGTKYAYIVYKRNYGYDTEKGPDGSYYYVNNTKFTEYKKGNLNLNADGTFSFDINLKHAGEYFVRVIAYVGDYRGFSDNKKGSKMVILGEVQKRINYYGFKDYGYYSMGDEKNNFVLSVNIPQKNYKVGEQIPININPYKKGAYLLITVERGKQILDVYHKTLNGGKITIPVKENYFPNVNISVIEFVGEQNFSKYYKNKSSDNHQKKSSEISNRYPEPRFYVGYTQADIDTNLAKLIIKIKTDKKEYKPGEKAKITIYTTTYDGKPVEARLSVAIVDKALADLYDIIKKPIPYFYNKLGSFIINSSNWKQLYQALKVFVSDGEKGGGGGDEGEIFSSIRKKLYDLAFWTGGVYTKNGKITLQTTLPDNTTTWMIDVIGITKDIRLGTQRAYFKVSKPLIIQANLPTFITIGDSLNIPVSLISSKLKGNGQIEVFQRVDNEPYKKIFQTSSKLNNQILIPISLNKQYFDKNYLYLKFKAKAGNETDALEVKIPIRTNGFILHQFNFTGSKIGRLNFKLDDLASSVKYSFVANKLPIEAFVNAFKYLLHYPYGCTEQLTSGLYPILVASKLNKQNIPLGDLIKNGKVNLHGDYKNIKDVVEETIEKIFKNQKRDGGLGYWPDSSEKSNPILSSYVYGAILEAKNQGYDVDDKKLEKLEKYLNLIGNNKVAYLYYLWIRTTYNKKINVALFESMLKNLSPEEKLLAFAIYANLGENQKALEWEKQVNISDIKNLEDRYWNFLNQKVAKAIYLRALLKLGEKEKASKIVLNLLNQRDSRGIWGRGTQQNVQILLALGDYIIKTQSLDKEIVCKVKINNEENTIKFKKIGKIEKEFKNIKNIPIHWTCSDDVLIDQKVDYVLKDFTKIKTNLHNLTGVNWTYTGGKTPGSIGTWEGSFTVEKNASQLAVEFYIPSNYKFLANVSKQNYDKYNRPFEINGNTYCKWNLKHYEVRFDRLFLYYDSLPAGTTCKFKIKSIKGFDGKTNLMPTHIFEMYKTNVWGIKVSKNNY